jgi:hypothetical protein
MDEDLKAWIIIGVLVVLGILAFIVPIVLCINYCKDKDIELEKYTLELQTYGEAIPKDVLKEDR